MKLIPNVMRLSTEKNTNKKKIAILEPNDGLRESLNLILEDYDLYHAVEAKVE